MRKIEMLQNLRTIFVELEDRRAMIAPWLVNEDPEVALIGRQLQKSLQSLYPLLTKLITAIEQDGKLNDDEYHFRDYSLLTRLQTKAQAHST